jgi:hypothetical protein
LALVFRAGTGLSTSPDFAIFMDKPAQQIDIFIIYYQTFIGAELAGSGAIKSRLPALKSASSGSFFETHVFVHNKYSLYWIIFYFMLVL